MVLEEVLRAGGHRVTSSRLLVWDVLERAEGHLSAQEIAERVWQRDPGVNVSSVYRTLALFAELDLVRESNLGEAATWEPRHDDTVIHLLCEQCGTVQHHDSVAVRRLRRELSQEAHFDSVETDVRVRGRCERCRAAGPATSAGPAGSTAGTPLEG